MPNANITLPYGVTKQIRIAGKNAANTAERPINTIGVTCSNPTVSVAATADPQIFDVKNNNTNQNFTGTITWGAKNELNNAIAGQTTFTAVPADPAVTIESTEQ